MDAECTSSIVSHIDSKTVVSEDVIKDLLHRRYGIQTSVIKEYESYEDRAYYVKTEQGVGDSKKLEFIAKVLNSEITAVEGLVAVQSDVLEHLKSFPDLGCSHIVPNLDGNLFSYEMVPCDFHEGDEFVGRHDAWCALRLYEFLPGKPLFKVSPFPPSFFFKVGKHLGSVQKALQEYGGDVKPLKVKAETYKWSLSLLPCVRDYLSLVKDTRRRHIFEDIISQFEGTVVPVMGDLRKGPVYHDYNGDNVIVAVSSGIDRALVSDSSVVISGLIDFDDMMYSCLLYDVAIGMMYMMYCSDQPLEAAAYFLAGFETVSPLPSNERRLLKVLVAGRFIQSLAFGSLQSQIHPNNEYVGVSLIKGWSLLEQWWNQSESQLELLRESVQSECLKLT